MTTSLPQSEEPGPGEQVENRPLVLLVDDSDDVHRLLRARLKQEEIRLASAHGGAEALEQARMQDPALVLLDLDMPGMDGFEVLRRLKDDSKTVSIAVIVLSGLQGAQDKVTAFDLGAVDYVTKPFDFTELRVRVRSALRLHKLLQLLAQRAQLDGLTGLWNRRFFDQRWTEEVARSIRHGKPLSVALLDVDHFKSVNDTFGHPAGDAVLQGVARLVQQMCRSTDVACRYGGEEFVIVMPETGPEDAKVLCERIRTAIEGATWPRHPQRTITASLGVAGTSGLTSESLESWVEQADKALYSAKHAGRNRVVCADLTATKPALRQAG